MSCVINVQMCGYANVQMFLMFDVMMSKQTGDRNLHIRTFTHLHISY